MNLEGREAITADRNFERILVVDDDVGARRMLARILERFQYPAETAADTVEAREMLRKQEFALVLTDMNMPGGTGLELVRHIADAYPDTATIMVTGEDDAELARVALDLGAYGYIVKPYGPNEIPINVLNALQRRRLEMRQREYQTELKETVRERTQELWGVVTKLEIAERDLRESREETIQRLAMAGELRDDETGQHVQRMSRYCAVIGAAMGMTTEAAELLRLASVMHDVGKIGIPDSILLKPGKLTEEEFEIMKGHTTIGARLLSGSRSDLLDQATQIALTHHERFDGSGYPNGLKGEAIPIEGRIAAVADVFDAISTKRVYRKAYGVVESINILKEGRGTDFDPSILDLFLEEMSEVLAIKDEFEEGK